MQEVTSFFHRLFHPHCEHCEEERVRLRVERARHEANEREERALREERDREERQENRVCRACETLRMQLESAVAEKRMLLEALTRKDEVISATPPSELQPIMPRHTPWRVRQQVLEAESRQAAAILKKKLDELNPDAPRNLHVAAPATPAVSTEELEQEMDLVEKEREGGGVR